MKQEHYRECAPGDLPEDEPEPETKAWFVYIQPDLRYSATLASHFRTCRLPKCRRMKQCTGRHPIERIHTGGLTVFPPCVTCEEKRAALMQELHRIDAEMEAQEQAAGADPDTL